jgi:thioredoxin-related protein
MRKAIYMFILALLLFSNSSCASTPKISVETNQDIQATIEVDRSALQNMMNSEQAFILYVYESTCTSCMEFRPILLEVIEIHHLVIYSAVSNSLTDSLTIEFTPTLFTIANGKVLSSINMYHQPNSFASVSQFVRYLDTVIEW